MLLVRKLTPDTEGTERLKKEVSHSRLVGGRFNKQRNLHTSPHPPARILKVYTEALPGFSHVFSGDGLNNTLLSQGCVPGTAPTEGTVGRGTFQDRGACEVSLSAQLCPLDDLIQHTHTHTHTHTHVYIKQIIYK